MSGDAMFHTEYFDFTREQIRQAVAEKRLLAMEVEFNRACNYRCPYCYACDEDSSEDEGDLITSPEIDSVIDQAAALGVRKIVVLGGEPLLYRELEEKIERITKRGMRAEVFTNGALMNGETAAMLFRNRARVVLKLNSLDQAVQERMTGVKGALEKTFRALAILREAGYSGAPGLLAASSVICSENEKDMTALWRYLRNEGIIPYFEILTPQGRMRRNAHLHVPPRRLEEIFREIAEIDRVEFGRDWTPQPPLVGGCCFRHHYSCLVNAGGVVMPCVGVTIPIGNIREKSLKDIIFGSKVLQDLKSYENRIKGPCGRCDKKDRCYGCRGAAYQMTGDYLASDPLCWRNADCRDEILGEENGKSN